MKDQKKYISKNKTRKIKIFIYYNILQHTSYSIKRYRVEGLPLLNGKDFNIVSFCHSFLVPAITQN